MPAAGLPVVPFFTVPWTVPACTPANGESKRHAKTANRPAKALTEHSDRPAPSEPPSAAALVIPSPDQFRQEPTPLPFRAQLSSSRNRLRNIFPIDIQSAGPGDCRKSCRGAPAIDPALTGEEPGPMHQGEYRK